MADIAVKNIHYQFDQNDYYTAAHDVAVQKVEQAYQDEADFQREEYEQMLIDGEIADMDDYKKFLDLSPEDVDHSLPFEQNIGHERIQTEINQLTQKYMTNIYDIPKQAVVSIPDNAFDSKGRPDKQAVIEALQDKIGKEGVRIHSYEAAGIADRTDILKQQAYESVSKMMESNEYQQFLSLRASIQKYSHGNIALIYAQKPDAKAVMGFKAWDKLDRFVSSGRGSGIAIYQPCSKEKRTEKAIDAYIEKEKADHPDIFAVNPDGSCPKAERLKERLMKELAENGVARVDDGFKLGSVFDISQTSPKDPTKDNLQDIVNLNKPLLGDLANYDDVLKSMQDAATITSFSVGTSADKSEQEHLFDALLKYADTVLKDAPDKVVGIKSDTPLTGDMHKIETVMTAYMIAEHIGIDTADKAGLMLADAFKKGLTEQKITIGKREMFMQAFDRAASLSDMFVRDFDKSFGIDIEAQREAVAKKIEEAKAAKEAADKAYKDTHTKFGTTPVLITDKWQSGKATFIIGQSENTGSQFVKITGIGVKTEYLKNDEGKPMKFDDKPDRATCETLYANQLAERKAAKKAPAPSVDANEPDKKKTADIDR